MEKKSHLVLAFYHFIKIDNPHEEVKLHKQFFTDKEITSRIYISEDGINGQMSGIRKDAESYMHWMHSRPKFANVIFKLHEYHEQAFPRAIVKYRPQLVAFDETIDLANTGEHVSPEKWKEMLETVDDKVLLDVRNEYEWKVGHFEGSELPPCDTFREFRKYADELKERVDPKKTPVMMCCTGGIRCELYSAVLKERGFDKVFQLDGGIINYGLKQGNDHWLGKLFVFDDRMVVPISNDEHSTIGSCRFCNTPNDTYYNCANTDCNELFLCCPECVVKHKGCCQESCETAKRVRPYQPNSHKPFRKKHHYENCCKIKNNEK
jgi:UPF0176 protein